MPNSILRSAFLILLLWSGPLWVSGQAKNAIGLGPALNVSGNGGGFGAVLQGEIKVARSFSVAPALGVELPYVGYFSLSGRYYLSRAWYGSLGGIAYVGGENGAGSGLGGTAAIGHQIFASRRHILDLSLHGDVLKVNAQEMQEHLQACG